MAAEVARGVVTLYADTRRLKKDLGDAEQRTHKLGRSMKIGLAAGAAAAGAGLAALAVGAKKSIDAASNLEEQINKNNVVFGKSAQMLMRWSKTTAGALGISQRAALEATGTFGNMLVPLGVSEKQAAVMSKRMVTLAADMASFNNASPEETLDALRSGLAGETEPLRRFGVSLNDARLKAEALALGIYKGKGPLDAQAKAQASYSLILKDTAKAQGDFGNTSDSLANQQRILKAQFEDGAAALGRTLLPAAVKLMGVATDLVPKLQAWGSALIDRLRPAFEAVAEAVTRVVQAVRERLPQIQVIAQQVFGWIQTNVFPIFRQLADIARDAFNSIVDVLRQHEPQIRQIFENLSTIFREAIVPVLQNVVLPILRLVFTEVLPRAIGIAIQAIATFTTAIAGISRFVNGLREKFSDFWLWLRQKATEAALAVVEPFSHLPGKMGNWARQAKNNINAELDKIKAEKEVRISARIFASLSQGARNAPDNRGVRVSNTGDGLAQAADGLINAYIGDNIGSFLAANPSMFPAPTAAATGSAAGLKPMILDELAIGQSMGLRLSSGYRPGARVAGTNRPSLHSVGQAIDMVGTHTQKSAFARAVYGRPGIAEVLYDPLGGPFLSPRRDHSDHVHVGATSGDGQVGVGDGPGGRPISPGEQAARRGERVGRQARALARIRTQFTAIVDSTDRKIGNLDRESGLKIRRLPEAEAQRERARAAREAARILRQATAKLRALSGQARSMRAIALANEIRAKANDYDFNARERDQDVADAEAQGAPVDTTGLPPDIREAIAAAGLTEPSADDIAALRRAEAYWESVIANPATSQEERIAAMDALKGVRDQLRSLAEAPAGGGGEGGGGGGGGELSMEEEIGRAVMAQRQAVLAARYGFFKEFGPNVFSQGPGGLQLGSGALGSVRPPVTVIQNITSQDPDRYATFKRAEFAAQAALG